METKESRNTRRDAKQPATRKAGRPKKEARKERIPFGNLRQKLNVPQIPGYRQYFFIDKGNRIADAQAAGYEFVTQQEQPHVGDKGGVEPDQLDQGTKVTKFAGSNEHGKPQHYYLMKIKNEWYLEDKAEKARRIDAQEEAIKQPKDGHFYGDVSMKVQ